ncbi:type II secretion system protein GspL [Grimontia marina]|uniref:Type II secretion system protein L n=1 Tax=Grimontia marina TaxID=646534 RepID=A0A128F648_9GAMM|nr:type II secretion system protein GspL [Grimontia marina]CZF81940.1 Type II secretion system protein L [Grimontia marina]
MSEILTIRLNSDPQESIPWLVWSPAQQEVIASGEAESLSQLTDYAADRDVVALADSAAMTLTTATIPAGSERQLDTVLPFLLEDDLAQDVDQVHITLLGKSGELANVAVIEHKVLLRWLDDLSEANLHVRKLVPDCLCLPLHDDGYSAANLNHRWLLRTGETEGSSAEEGWLPVWLQSLDSAQEKGGIKTVYSYSDVPEDMGDKWKAEPCELVMLLLAQQAMQSRYNLLVGRYKPQNQIYKHLKPWRGAAIAAAVLLAVLGGKEVADIYQMESQAAQYREQSEAKVRALLPQNQRIPTTSYMRRILEGEVNRLSGAGTQSGVMVWMAELGPLLESAPGIQLDAMRFDQDRGELRLNARGKDFGDFEKLRKALSSRYNTELGQLSRDQQTVTGAFVLRKEPS